MNGGLVASAGFSLSSTGPSYRNRPQADNTHSVNVYLLQAADFMLNENTFIRCHTGWGGMFVNANAPPNPQREITNIPVIRVVRTVNQGELSYPFWDKRN